MDKSWNWIMIVVMIAVLGFFAGYGAGFYDKFDFGRWLERSCDEPRIESVD